MRDAPSSKRPQPPVLAIDESGAAFINGMVINANGKLLELLHWVAYFTAGGGPVAVTDVVEAMWPGKTDAHKDFLTAKGSLIKKNISLANVIEIVGKRQPVAQQKISLLADVQLDPAIKQQCDSRHGINSVCRARFWSGVSIEHMTKDIAERIRMAGFSIPQAKRALQSGDIGRSVAPELAASLWLRLALRFVQTTDLAEANQCMDRYYKCAERAAVINADLQFHALVVEAWLAFLAGNTTATDACIKKVLTNPAAPSVACANALILSAYRLRQRSFNARPEVESMEHLVSARLSAMQAVHLAFVASEYETTAEALFLLINVEQSIGQRVRGSARSAQADIVEGLIGAFSELHTLCGRSLHTTLREATVRARCQILLRANPWQALNMLLNGLGRAFDKSLERAIAEHDNLFALCVEFHPLEVAYGLLELLRCQVLLHEFQKSTEPREQASVGGLPMLNVYKASMSVVERLHTAKADELKRRLTSVWKAPQSVVAARVKKIKSGECGATY